MPWFKVDDGFWSHPKVLELSDEAVALWVRAGSYCAGHLTDGEVKRSTLRILGATHDAATELVIAGLWDQGDGVWTFHDWDVYQPSKETVVAERQAAAERMRVLRANRKKRSAEQPENVQANVQENVRDEFADGSPSPTRPDPTLSISDEIDSPAPRKRAHSIPDDFSINDRMRAWAAENVPLVDIDAKLPEFIDYWRGVGKPMKDWESTWRNGMRKQQGFAERDAQQGAPMSKADRNAAEFQRLYGGGGGDQRTRSVPAIDAGVGA